MTSASAFENLNRHLKRSITGTKGQAHQILTRFVLSQRIDSSKARVSYPHALGRAKRLTSKMITISMDLPYSCHSYIDRFSSNGKVFHSFHYGRKLKCASYYAFLDNCFVKIKYIFMSSDSHIYCVCRKFVKLRKLHLDFSFPDTTKQILDTISPYFMLEKRDVMYYKGDLFTDHAMIHKNNDQFYGVRILSNFEHE